MSLFDILVGISFVVAMVAGAVRGGVRGLMGLISVLAGAFVALHALGFTGRIAANLVEQKWAVAPLAMAIGFVPTYIAVRLLGAVLARQVQETPVIGVLDRLVGAGFGFMRVLFILGLFNIAFTAVAGQGGPRFVTDAAVFPLTTAAARLLHALAPQARELTGNLTSDLAKPTPSGYDDPATARRSPAR